MAELTALQHEVSSSVDAIEFCYEKGWSDGLPVVPPTADKVRAMLEAAGLRPEQQIGYIPERRISITAEKVAINAVLAGCLPEYMPVVVAAVEGICDPLWAYHGPSTTTSGPAVLLIVNGPIARKLNINSKESLFGPGWRANLTIGRALRLVMRNVCGTIPGTLDMATIGNPGKLSYVIAENEEDSPWLPFHVDRGFRAQQSTVTVMAADGPCQIFNQLSDTPEQLLLTMADNMRISGGVVGQTYYVVILPGEHLKIIADAGWSKAQVQKFLFEHTYNNYAHLRRTGRFPFPIKPGDEYRMRPLVTSPEMFFVLSAGGTVGAFSAFIPGWAKAGWSRAVTKEIKQ
ncbi:MAG: hypothetical protein ACRYG5_02750 [Janthinobacterium lividum]